MMYSMEMVGVFVVHEDCNVLLSYSNVYLTALLGF